MVCKYGHSLHTYILLHSVLQDEEVVTILLARDDREYEEKSYISSASQKALN